MNGLFCVSIWIVLLIVVIIVAARNHPPADRAIIAWMIFSILASLYELAMLLHRNYLAKMGPKLQKSNFWERRCSVLSTFDRSFWLDGWIEYTKIDPRYLKPNNYVHAMELINMLTMFPMAVALFGILTKRIPRKKIKLMMALISVVQLTSTVLYYITWYMEVRKGGKYLWYLLFDLPWIVMPIYGIIWGLKKNF